MEDTKVNKGSLSEQRLVAAVPKIIDCADDTKVLLCPVDFVVVVPPHCSLVVPEDKDKKNVTQRRSVSPTPVQPNKSLTRPSSKGKKRKSYMDQHLAETFGIVPRNTVRFPSPVHHDQPARSYPSASVYDVFNNPCSPSQASESQNDASSKKQKCNGWPTNEGSCSSPLPLSSDKQAHNSVSPQNLSPTNPSSETNTVDIFHLFGDHANPCVALSNKMAMLKTEPQYLEEVQKKLRPYHCRMCDFSFKTRKIAQSHWQRHDADQFLKFQCDVCEGRFPSWNKLQEHYHTTKECRDQVSVRKMQAGHTGKEQSPGLPKQLKCHICGMKFHLEDEYKTHILVHAGQCFRCGECSEIFHQRKALEDHQLLHNAVAIKKEPDFLKCDIDGCHYKTLIEREMGSHRLKHLEEPLHYCYICQSGFLSAEALQYHLFGHETIPFHTCFECGKNFIQSITFNKHLKLHVTNETYTCTFCSATFSNSDDLEDHVFEVHPSVSEKGCDTNGNRKSPISSHNGNIRQDTDISSDRGAVLGEPGMSNGASDPETLQPIDMSRLGVPVAIQMSKQYDSD